MEIWVLTTESDDFDSEIVALSGSMAEAMLAAETYAGGSFEWDNAHRTCYSPKVGRLSLRGPFPFPFAMLPYSTWEERRCGARHGDFVCQEAAGHDGAHKSGPGGYGDGRHGSIEWPRCG